jgi:serine/threonine protein phosphatase 1
MFNLFQKKQNNKSRQFAIGDVHGHFDGLCQLIDFCKPTPTDQVYFLGDVIDRGPKSAQVVKWIRERNYPCLMGNHEIMLLTSFNNGDIDEVSLSHWLPSGGNTTLQSYGDAGIPQADIDWFASLPSYIDLGDTFLVHAGVDPFRALDKQDNDQFCWTYNYLHLTRGAPRRNRPRARLAQHRNRSLSPKKWLDDSIRYYKCNCLSS